MDDQGSYSWSGIYEELSRISRVCAYDRGGILWSEPRGADRSVSELHALLGAATEEPPYVMVGHSLGGLLVRVYDDRYPGEIQGFVLVDSSHRSKTLDFPRKCENGSRERGRIRAGLSTPRPVSNVHR